MRILVSVGQEIHEFHVWQLNTEKLVGTLDGAIIGEGSDPSFAAKEKMFPGFTVAGESASFRNVRIYTAKAEPKGGSK